MEPHIIIAIFSLLLLLQFDWFERALRLLWRHCNDACDSHPRIIELSRIMKTHGDNIYSTAQADVQSNVEYNISISKLVPGS